MPQKLLMINIEKSLNVILVRADILNYEKEHMVSFIVVPLVQYVVLIHEFVQSVVHHH